MKKTKLIAILAITAIAVGGISVGAYNYYKTINVEPGPSLYIDHQSFVPKNALGQPVETFIYEGTTYVPIRAISEAFDKDVNYNSLFNSVEITTPMVTDSSIDFVEYACYSQLLTHSTQIFHQLIEAYGIYISYANAYQRYGNVTIDQTDLTYLKNNYDSLCNYNSKLKNNISIYRNTSTELNTRLYQVSKFCDDLEDAIKIYKDIYDSLNAYPSDYYLGSYASQRIKSSVDDGLEICASLYGYSDNICQIEEKLSNGIIDY